MTYPFAPEVLAELAYYFADANYGAQYQANVGRMVGRLREKYDRWASLWAWQEHRPRLQLSERGGATTVYDSRSGTAVEYPIPEAAHRVLGALGTAKNAGQLEKELECVRVEEELAWLRERGLVFHEGKRYLSLVVPPARPISVPVGELQLAATA
jgi:hypothetical protein